MYLYIYTCIQMNKVRVCGAGLTYAPMHWPLRSDPVAKKRALNKACFPVAMATPGGKQHLVPGMALSCWEMLPGPVPAVCYPSGFCCCPAVPTTTTTFWGPVGAPDLPQCVTGGKRGSCLGRLVGMERSQAAVLMPPTCTAFTLTQPSGLCGVGNKLPQKNPNQT